MSATLIIKYCSSFGSSSYPLANGTCHSNMKSTTNSINTLWLMVKLDHMPNLDHIETVSGSKEQFYVDWELADKRRVRKKQRRLFFALLNDIVDHFIVPQDFLKGS